MFQISLPILGQSKFIIKTKDVLNLSCYQHHYISFLFLLPSQQTCSLPACIQRCEHSGCVPQCTACWKAIRCVGLAPPSYPHTISGADLSTISTALQTCIEVRKPEPNPSGQERQLTQSLFFCSSLFEERIQLISLV